ncbi:hypothetical protein BH23ACT9_BH23ACT9_37780 [soil metagenome]
MIAVAALATGICTAFAVAALTIGMPSLRRASRTKASTSATADLLRRAGIGLTPSPLVGVSAAAGLVVAAVVASATPVRSLAVVPAGIAAAGPTVWLRRRAAARVCAVRRAWPDALSQISGNVRAGRPLSHALIDVSLNGPPALVGPLAGLAARIQTVGLVPALHAVRTSLAEPVTDRVVEVLVLAHAEGGRIVLDVLEDLSATISAEVAAAEETETLALEGKLNARVVFALPWVVLVFLTARPGPFQTFYTSASGAAVIAVGAVISLLGIALVSRLSAVEDEPRVLVDAGEGPA